MAMGYLNPEVKTPNLDRLVESGTTFHRAYTVNPTCTPTRASWITGLYPSQHGAYSLGTKLMEDVPTVGDVFNEQGYPTRLTGRRAESMANQAARANPDVVVQTGFYSLKLDCDTMQLSGYDAVRGSDYISALNEDGRQQLRVFL